MPCHRPDLNSVHRRFDQFPVRAIVIAAIQPRLGSGENPMRIVWRHGEAPNLDLTGLSMERQLHPAAPPMLPGIGAMPYAFADRAHTDRKLRRHRLPPASLAILIAL